MLPIRAAPLLPSLLAGVMLGLLTWASINHREAGVTDTLMKSHDGALSGFFALAVFALVTFLVYVLLGIQP